MRQHLLGWAAIIVTAALVAAAEVLVLGAQRRRFLAQRPRMRVSPRRLALRDAARPLWRAAAGLVARLQATRPAHSRPVQTPEPPLPTPAIRGAQERDAEAPADPPLAGRTLPATDSDEGLVYVDRAGRLTFATQTARDLLHWQHGELTLADVLAGADAAVLLDAVARDEFVTQAIMISVAGTERRLEMNALALRDRHGMMWGAALFLRPPATT